MRTHLTDLFTASELFVEPTAFRQWLASATAKAAGIQSAEGVQAAMAAYDTREQGPRLVGDVAVLDVCGPITYKSGWMSYYYGATAIADLQAKFRMALADPAVRTVLFRYDTPGGEVGMVPEFADEIFAARGQKPIVAVADLLVASAGYWLAAMADTIYTPVSGRLGSIGVFTEHMDISGMLEKAGVQITLIHHGPHKVDGHPYAPLSDDVKARIQARVDEIGVEFEAAVGRGRKVSKKDVADGFGGGEVFRGKQAIALGMADKLGTFSQVLARLTKNRPAGAGMMAAAPATDTESAADTTIEARKTGSDGCQTCSEACACEEAACADDCPTCADDCPCRHADDAAARAAAADADGIIAVLAAE